MTLDQFFDHLWADYSAMTPQAPVIKAAFEARGERVVNDHVAFRTLALEPIGLKALEPHLLAIGYTPYEPYKFEDKKLDAWGYLPPKEDQPRVFVSELRVDELSPRAAQIMRSLAKQVDAARVKNPDVLWAATPADIAKLLTKSKPGETLSIPDLRSKIAAQMKADAACPVTTSMFLRIVAEAALEDLEAGAPADKVTPFWRAIDPNTPLAAKLSCGAAGLARLRKSDGIV